MTVAAACIAVFGWLICRRRFAHLLPPDAFDESVGEAGGADTRADADGDRTA